jgi:uncharacterized GH25 family protein
MTLAKPILPLVLMAGAAGLWAHFVWVDAMPVTLKTGETAKVRIGNGHDLAESESALNLAGLETFAIAPSGGRTDLKPEIAGKWVVAPYSVKEAIAST